MPAAERGVALVITLLAVSLFSALGLGLVLSSATARLADHNHEEGVTLLNAAESALELAARDLAAIGDWTDVLNGSVRSSVTDGAAGGTRAIPAGGTIDLTRLTNQLTCGRDTACSDPLRTATTADRPWGSANPRWRLFLHGAIPLVSSPRHRQAPYAVVWVGDDPREADGDVGLDGGGPGAEGRYVVRVRAEAFGAQQSRRAIEAEAVRLCHPGPAGDVCLPGVRLQSWRVAAGVP